MVFLVCLNRSFLRLYIATINNAYLTVHYTDPFFIILKALIYLII